MPTGYTEKELIKLRDTFAVAKPHKPVAEMFDRAEQVLSLEAASGPYGVLVVLKSEAGEQSIFLNPVVSIQLAQRIIEAAENGDWWDPNGALRPR